MELIIVKNGSEVLALSHADDIADYTLHEVERIPSVPLEPLGYGKKWVLVWDNGNLIWTQKERELTIEEKALAYDDAVNGLGILGVR